MPGDLDLSYLAVAGIGAALVGAHFGAPDSLVVVALGLGLLAMGGLGKDGKGILSSKPLVYLGEISFATYMIYVPWKWVYLKGIDMVLGLNGAPLPAMWWLIGLVALVPLSMLAHHAVELPFRRVVRRWGEQLVNKPTPKTA